MHVDQATKPREIARKLKVSVNTVNGILWGLSHLNITQGRNVSQARQNTAERAELIRVVYAATGSKTAAARAAGVTWQGANYHLTKDAA
jgi:hypothetical protein